jgi:hypothetical protein
MATGAKGGNEWLKAGQILFRGALETMGNSSKESLEFRPIVRTFTLTSVLLA